MRLGLRLDGTYIYSFLSINSGIEWKKESISKEEVENLFKRMFPDDEVDTTFFINKGFLKVGVEGNTEKWKYVKVLYKHDGEWYMFKIDFDKYMKCFPIPTCTACAFGSCNECSWPKQCGCKSHK